MKCPVCNAQIADDSKFCVHCGSKIEVGSGSKSVPMGVTLCKSCGAELKAGTKFCPKCGTKQEDKAETAGQSTSAQGTGVRLEKNNIQGAGMRTENPAAQGAGVRTENPAAQGAGVKAENPAVQGAGVRAGNPAAQGTGGRMVNFPGASNASLTIVPGMRQEPGVGDSGQKGGILKIILVAAAVLIVLGCGAFFIVRGINSGNSAGNPGSTTMQENAGAGKQGQGSAGTGGSTADTTSAAQDNGEADAGKDATAQEKGDESLFDTTDELVQKAHEEFADAAYIDAHRDSKKALQNYLSIAEKNNLKPEAQDRVEDVYRVYVDSIIAYGEILENQKDYLANTRYDAIKDMTDPAGRLTEEIKSAGYSIDSTGLEEYSSGLAGRYKDFYIKAINEFADSEETGTPWPRDDAWKYASSAYSIQQNGKVVLFDENNLEDPLRLRYIFCLAWITTKRCEQGIKDGSMDAEGAARTIQSILEETDYNPLLLQTYVSYANQAGIGDADKYQRAYDMIVDKIREEQNLTIDANNTGSYTGNNIDLRYFRYFNDLDGREEYLVDSTNGTRAATRTWIRENIPDVLE